VQVEDEKVPAEAVLAVQRAYDLKQKDELDDAYAEAKKASTLAPDYPLAQILTGDMANALNRYDDAEVAYRKLVDLDKARLDKAKKGDKKPIERDLQEDTAYLAGALLAAGKPDDALAILLPLDKDKTAAARGAKDVEKNGLAKT